MKGLWKKEYKKLSVRGRSFNFILMKREEGERKKERSTKRYTQKSFISF